MASRRNVAFIVISVLLTTMPVACAAGPGGGGGELVPGTTRITVSSGLDSVTILARDVPRARILYELQVVHGIEVRSHDVADERISVQIVDVPIDEAVEQFLPPGSRYVIRLGRPELARGPLSKGDKAGDAEVRPRDVPTKDDTVRVQVPHDTVKVDPRRWQEPEARVGPGLKPHAAQATDVRPGRGPKAERVQAAADSSVRLSFIITLDGTVRPVQAAIVDGSVVTSPVVRGPFLFAVRGPNNALLHFGALPDPLELHRYLESGEHDVDRAAEGTFGLWIPGTVLAANPMASLTLEFYDARAVTLPQSLDEEAFEKAAEEARRVAAIDGRIGADMLQRAER